MRVNVPYMKYNHTLATPTLKVIVSDFLPFLSYNMPGYFLAYFSERDLILFKIEGKLQLKHLKQFIHLVHNWLYHMNLFRSVHI